MSLPFVDAKRAAELAKEGAVLVDIRSEIEHRNRHIPESVNRPLNTLNEGQFKDNEVVVFFCQSGMRTRTNAAKLAAAAKDAKEVYCLEGGIQAWQSAGQPVEVAARAALDIQRQVQILVGIFIVLGVVLGYWVNPAWLILSGLVGAGLLFAGITGFCGMARLLILAPWNRAA